MTLFADVDIVAKEPEEILDDNDSDPANEATWLSRHAALEAEINAAEEEFFAEYKRRHKLGQ